MHGAGKGSLATTNTVAADCPKQLGNQRGLADGEQEAQTVHHQVHVFLHSVGKTLVIGDGSEKHSLQTPAAVGGIKGTQKLLGKGKR